MEAKIYNIILEKQGIVTVQGAQIQVTHKKYNYLTGKCIAPSIQDLIMRKTV